MLKLLGSRKFIFASASLTSLSAITMYALHHHDSGTAMAAVGAIAAIGPMFLHVQRKSDETDQLAAVAKGQSP